MTVADIKGRKEVLHAIAEFDRLGRDRFLEKYKFGPSRSYWLVHQGKQYDSKAIIGAARGYARPDLGPMTADEFSGGEATVRRKLEELGFAVDVMASDELNAGKPAQGPGAFLLTWKESGWPHSNIFRMLKEFEKQGYVEEPWRLRAYRQARPGDRVWALKQGAGPKGIFGVGQIVGPPRLGNAGSGKQQMMAPIRFSQFADPKKQLLIGEKEIYQILSDTQIRAQASGYPLTNEQIQAPEQRLPSASGGASPIHAADSDEQPFDPSNIADARERIFRTIVQRRGQKAFRDSLIAAYDGKCAISGCNIIDVLEAAHIYPYCGPDTNKTSNGLLLRADLHTLFDCLLIAIDPATLKVIISPQLLASTYKQLHDRKIRVPRELSQAPSKEALMMHRAESRL
jgi:putative restriction endonuclease